MHSSQSQQVTETDGTKNNDFPTTPPETINDSPATTPEPTEANPIVYTTTPAITKTTLPATKKTPTTTKTTQAATKMTITAASKAPVAAKKTLAVSEPDKTTGHSKNLKSLSKRMDILKNITGKHSHPDAFIPLNDVSMKKLANMLKPMLTSTTTNIPKKTFSNEKSYFNEIAEIDKRKSKNFPLNVNDDIESFAPQNIQLHTLATCYSKIKNTHNTLLRYSTLLADKIPPLLVVPPIIAVPCTQHFSDQFDKKANSILLKCSNNLSNLVLDELKNIHGCLTTEFNELMSTVRPNKAQMETILEIAETKIKILRTTNDLPPFTANFFIHPDHEKKQTLITPNPILRTFFSTGQRTPSNQSNFRNNNFRGFNSRGARGAFANFQQRQRYFDSGFDFDVDNSSNNYFPPLASGSSFNNQPKRRLSYTDDNESLFQPNFRRPRQYEGYN